VTEFKRALNQYLEGQLDEESLDAALQSTLSAAPDRAEELQTKLRDLHGEERVTERLYSTLMTRLRSAATAVDAGPEAESPRMPDKAGDDGTAVRGEQSVQSPDSMIGAVFRERFVLESEIGRGGMGIVYCATDLRREEAGDLQNKVAIKVLAGNIKEDPDAFVALQREAKRAQQLAHPNIATVYDFDREGDIAYLCMELLSGKPLDEILATTASDGLSFEAALPIIRGMSNGLAYAHERGIVHADFKPNNVLVTDDGVVKILDFGIARVISQPGRTAKTVFDAGRLQAMTPSYASCEMFNLQDPDPRDDIYALACVTYELLTGKHPFDNLAAPQARAGSLKPKPVAGLSKRRNRALQHGLAFEREHRTPSVDSFLEELTQPRRSATLGGLGAAAGITGLIGGIAIAGWLLSDEPPVPSTTADAEKESTARLEPAPESKEPDDAGPDQNKGGARDVNENVAGAEREPENKEPEDASPVQEKDGPRDVGENVAGVEPAPENTEADSAGPVQEKDGRQEIEQSVARLEPAPEPGVNERNNPGAEQKEEGGQNTAVSVGAVDEARQPLDAQTRAKIERILEIARLHLASGRLVEPPGSNAAEAFAAVGELDTGNPESRKGLEAVAAGIEKRASKLADTDASDEALEIVNAGLEWVPDHPGLTRLRNELQSEN